MSTIALPANLTIRLADEADDAALRRLAALDSRSAPPPGPLLIALGESGPLAAISLPTGDTIADPFTPTAAAVALLRARRRQLNGTASTRRRRRPRLGLGKARLGW